MGRDEVLAQVHDAMVDVFDLDDLEINDTTSADDIAEWDSLSHIRFIITLEKRFGIKFLNEEIGGLKNIGDLVTIIEQKLA